MGETRSGRGRILCTRVWGLEPNQASRAQNLSSVTPPLCRDRTTSEGRLGVPHLVTCPLPPRVPNREVDPGGRVRPEREGLCRPEI